MLAGTFWQNTILTTEPVIDPQVRLRTLCHVTPGEWMLEGIGFYCGMAMRWYRDAFCAAEVAAAQERGVDPYVVMEEQAARIPPGSNGVYAILSNLMNARRWVHASPSFVGFDLANPAGSGRAAGIRAVEEAAAYVVRGHLGIIRELTGAQISELTFSGGAAKGTLWPQIIADVLGVPVHVPAVTESSALGAALCAGTGAGLYARLTDLEGELRKRAATFEPSRPRWPRTPSGTSGGSSSTPGCSPSLRTGCSTRCGGRRARPGRLTWIAEGRSLQEKHARHRQPDGRGPVRPGRAGARRAVPAQRLRRAGLGHAEPGWPGCSSRPPAGP